MLTVQQRINHYAIAIERLLWRQTLGLDAFVCNILEGTYRAEFGKMFHSDIKTMYPEFAKQKPLLAHRDENWWPKGDIKSRIKALSNAIKLANRAL